MNRETTVEFSDSEDEEIVFKEGDQLISISAQGTRF